MSAQTQKVDVLMRNERLEEVSNKIRSGEPVHLLEAIAAIDYQQSLREEAQSKRSKKWWVRAWRRIVNRSAARIGSTP